MRERETTLLSSVSGLGARSPLPRHPSRQFPRIAPRQFTPSFRMVESGLETIAGFFRAEAASNLSHTFFFLFLARSIPSLFFSVSFPILTVQNGVIAVAVN